MDFFSYVFLEDSIVALVLLGIFIALVSELPKH